MKKIIIAISTLALIVTAFASCTKTGIETTTYEPVIEFPTEETTGEEVTTEASTTEEATTETPAVEESTTEAPTTEVPTTKEPETTTKTPETTTKVPETTTKPVETTTKAPEPTTEEQVTDTPSPDVDYDDPNINVISVKLYSPIRAGLIYNSNGNLTTYDKLAEGEMYFEYDSDGYEILKQKPYSSDNAPVIDRDHCSVCGKKTTGYDGEHYGCYYGYCERWMRNVNCPECGEFVKANTCHTCKF